MSMRHYLGNLYLHVPDSEWNQRPTLAAGRSTRPAMIVMSVTLECGGAVAVL